MILAGDVGGTNTRLAFFEAGHPVLIEIFSNAEHSGLGEIARKFLAAHGRNVDAAYFGIAGTIRDGMVEAPNLPWTVNERDLRAALGIDEVRLVNDLLVNAHGIAALAQSDLVTLQEGDPDPEGNRGLISAGTGLGEAGLLRLGGEYVPYASEGGHADFAARNPTEIALLEYLLGRFSHVSYERVVSGPGLRNIYTFLRDTKRASEPSWLVEEMAAGDPAAAIARHAGDCEICTLALDIFVSVYGAEAGNLALRALATGGLFIGGGIAPKIVAHLRKGPFVRAFREKGRISTVLERMPVRVILNDKTALLGAGRLATIR